MNRDLKQNARLINWCNDSGLNWKERVIYQTTTKIDAKEKKGVMILDEADTLIFTDLIQFFQNTNYANLNVIGLTATPFHGKDNGVEKNAIDLLSFKLYCNNS